jgi:hypothetical protein
MFALAHAKAILESTIEGLRPFCQRMEIGGSVRRGNSSVKDGEIVAIPFPGNQGLLAHLDKMVAHGKLQQALYNCSPRWGSLYRGFIVDGLRVELFCTDPHSYGYQMWLRTGPRDANKVAMQWISHKKPDWRAQDGSIWYSAAGWKWDAEDKEWNAPDRQRCNVPEEVDMFRLLGLPHLPPAQRDEVRYQMLLRKPDHRFASAASLVIDAEPEPQVQQLSLFTPEAAPRQRRVYD